MVNQTTLKIYVQRNPKLVSMKESTSFPGLYVLKYRKTVFFNDLWDEFLEHCRGTVVDQDFNLVSYPFQKIYNFGIESRAPVLDDGTLVIAYRKVNGFMVSLSWNNGIGDIVVSTTGSLDSPFVAMAKEMMLTHQCWEDWQKSVASVNGQTLMFECVHPSDPHIIPEKPGMYFIGSRVNQWGSTVNGFGVKNSHSWDSFATVVLNCYAPESFVIPLSELKAKAKSCVHEGFVAYTAAGRSFKIKSPHYLVNKWVARNPRTDKLVDTKNDIKKKIDEEYHDLIDAIRLNIVEYTAMSEQERLAWIRNYFTKAVQ